MQCLICKKEITGTIICTDCAFKSLIYKQLSALNDCVKNDKTGDEWDFDYSVDDRGVIIDSYLGDKSKIAIPAYIEGKTVYKIGDNAFCGDNKLKQVVIPDTVRIIGICAFEGASVEQVILPESLLIIEEGAFSEAELTQINFPEGLAIIGKDAFKYTNIKFVSIPKLINSIGEGAFSGTDIESIVIPKRIKSISENLFSCCKKLQTVVIEGAEVIKESAFEDCSALKDIYLPDNLIKIEDRAFCDCGIEKMIIPQSVEMIGEENFPKNSHIAILGDKTEIEIVNDYVDYSTVTIYCNQVNTNVRRIAKEYEMERKPLSKFRYKEYDGFLCKSYEVQTTDDDKTKVCDKDYNKFRYCHKECDFFQQCDRSNNCIKSIIAEVLSTLAPRAERIVRLKCGIGYDQEESMEIISRAMCFTQERVNQVYAQALKRLRHPSRTRVLRRSIIGLIIFSGRETAYSKLYRMIFFGNTCSQEEIYKFFIEEQKKEDDKRLKFEKKKKEQQPQITLEMTLKDCCFSEVCQNMPKVDMTIGELIKLTGKEFVSKFGKELFEEVALVLSVYNLYFADCDEAMRKDIELYIGLICLKYTFSYA